MSRRAPRRLSAALAAFTRQLAPVSTLADVQTVWLTAVGGTIARHAAPVAERGGVLTVTCDEAVWASELDLMGPELVAGLNQALGRDALSALRCRATPPR
jgi:predicted nucleic acid-binding Zn ribbon protein